MDSRRLDAGRVNSRRPTAGRSGRRPRVTGHRTAGHRTPKPDGGHPMLDTGDRPRGWPAGRVDHGDHARPLDTGWTLLRADVVWASTNQDRSAARTPRAPTQLPTGLAPPRPSAAGGTPLSSWRLGALLSSDDYGSSVERDAAGQVLWRGICGRCCGAVEWCRNAVNVAWTEFKALTALTWSSTGFSWGAEPGSGSRASQCRWRPASRASPCPAGGGGPGVAV